MLKQLWKVTVGGLMWCCLWGSMQIWAACPRPLTIGWESWPPYQYLNAQNKLVGLDVELVTAIVNHFQCQVTFQEMPWKRHLVELENGKIDLAAGASKTPEREKFADFSLAYRTESAVLYIRQGESSKFKFQKLADLKGTGFRLGVTREYYYGEDYAQLVKDSKFKEMIQEVQSDSLNYSKLLKGRIDGFLADPISATSGLKQEGLLGQVEILPIPIYSSDIFIMFSKASVTPEIRQGFEKSLAELKADGTLGRITSQYLQTPIAKN